MHLFVPPTSFENWGEYPPDWTSLRNVRGTGGGRKPCGAHARAMPRPSDAVYASGGFWASSLTAPDALHVVGGYALIARHVARLVLLGAAFKSGANHEGLAHETIE